jgi:hypothetical protein
MAPAFWKEPFLDMATNVWAMPEEQWIGDSPRQEDIEILRREAAGESNIDDGNLLGEMIRAWERGEAELHVRELPGRTRLVFLGTQGQLDQIPWLLWTRIFQAIGHPVGYTLLYANPKKRDFPSVAGEPIAAKHMNAGYSFICQKHTVVVYRFEEATRVLLHELLHTACFDSELPVEALEASTEAWTEVLLCALLSKGKRATFMRMWKQQVSWILAQTAYLESTWAIKTPADYAWRYTVGRHAILVEKGFMKSFKVLPAVTGLSLRFTTPAWGV